MKGTTLYDAGLEGEFGDDEKMKEGPGGALLYPHLLIGGNVYIDSER